MLPDDRPPDDRPLDLRAQWRAIVRRPWLVALGAVVGAAALASTVTRAETTYVSQAQLEILPVVGTWPTNNPGLAEALRVRMQPVIAEVNRRDPRARLSWRSFASGRSPFLTLEIESPDRARALSLMDTLIDSYLVVRSRQLSDEIGIRIVATELEVASAQAELDRVRGGGSPDPSASTNPEVAAAVNALQAPTPVASVTEADAQRRLASASKLLAELEKAQAAGPVIARLEGKPRISQTFDPPDPTLRNAGAGFVGGVLAGLLACLLVEKVGDRIRSRRDAAAAATPVPVLAVLPAGGRGKGGGDSLLAGGAGASVSEGVVALQAALGRPAGAGSARTILVAGVDEGDGAADLAASLASALASADTRVVAVDAALRSPRLHALLDVHEKPGLADALAGRAGDGPRGEPDPRGLVQPVASRRGLWAVPAGGAVPDPSSALSGGRLEGLLGALGRRVDWLVVHTAPVLHVADAVAVGAVLDAGRHDGVLLVAAAGRTTHRRLGDALDVLAQAAVPVLGVVVVGAAPADCPAYATAPGTGRAGR